MRPSTGPTRSTSGGFCQPALNDKSTGNWRTLRKRWRFGPHLYSIVSAAAPSRGVWSNPVGPWSTCSPSIRTWCCFRCGRGERRSAASPFDALSRELTIRLIEEVFSVRGDDPCGDDGLETRRRRNRRRANVPVVASGHRLIAARSVERTSLARDSVRG